MGSVGSLRYYRCIAATAVGANSKAVKIIDDYIKCYGTHKQVKLSAAEMMYFIMNIDYCGPTKLNTELV